MNTHTTGNSPVANRAKPKNELKFTFRDVRSVIKKNKTDAKKKAVEIRSRGNHQSDNVRLFADEAARFMMRLGASDEERSRFVSLCEICGIGRQDFKKNSLLTLFGEENDHGVRGLDEDEDEEQRETAFFANGPTFRIGDRNRVPLFLRMRNDSVVGGGNLSHAGGKRTTNKSLGSDGVYLITLLVSTFATGVETNKTRKPDTVFVGIPPVSGSRHGTASTDQDNLAELMIMKVYFIVRYIFTRLREEMKMASEPLDRYRYPAIVIQQQVRAQESASNNTQWYATMKAKIMRGDSPFTRSLSQEYYVNIV